ncbi:hypothetical protein F0562_015556 [Nyssa sinensis]|uniref:Rx N-terminal domain-containing protein n=1 Tax=Nyssa sinensis TaxID=561372 RepID=A0A5J4ZKP1_9ASTE|nr:hypothetical protein F0562_015556 [Nyssa sinensis]
MADTFLFGIVREITQKLASLAADEVKLAWGLEEELRRLEDTATTIEAVLLDAEEQQVRSRAVREWLRRLQDVVRDITNVVDDIATEALRRQVENQITDKVTRFLSKPKFQLQMGHKIRNIRKRLDEISADARQFNFINRDSDMPVTTRGRETYSYVRQSEVTGRDNDTENIVKELLGDSSNFELSAIAIIGIGGESDSRLTITFEMHDLMNDLARSVIGTEFSKIQDQDQDISKCVRHVLLTRPTFPELLLKFKMLWTFMWLFDNYDSSICVDPIIFSFRYLRVLDLSLMRFKELPSSIKKLKYLRFLNLFGNSAIKRLPTSICKLYNLQTLILSETDCLKELPKDIWKLISLRHLSVTSQQKSFPERGLGCLTALLTLSISGQFLESLPNSMQNLTVLEDLEISSCTELCFSENDMKGLYNLQRLSIKGLPRLVRIPLGLQHAATTLKCLHIGFCLGLIELPEWLGTFASLRRLTLIDCPKLTSLPQGISSLTNLKVLKILECPYLSRRCKKGIGEDWPKIAHVPQFYLDEEVYRI